MSQVAKYITAPYQGVSQAPPQVRLPEQAEVIEDCALNLPEGATKRPPITWLGTLAGHPGLTDGLFEIVQRPDGDRLLTATLESGVVVPRVYRLGDLTAESIDISSDAQNYLNASAASPVADMRVCTVQDYTFLTNRRKTVANGTDTNATRPFEAMIWARIGEYDKKYTVTVTPHGGSPVVVTYKTPDGSKSQDGFYVDTSVIAEIITNRGWTTADGTFHTIMAGGMLVEDGYITDATLQDLTALGFTVTLLGPVIYLSHAAADFTVAVEDGQDGTALVPIKDKVNAFSDLPKAAPDGFVVRITNETAELKDDFFVAYSSTAGVAGTWEECLAPGAALGLDPKTMPVGLTYSSGWHLNVLAWTERTVGDETLVKDPSFVGDTVQDLTFWRGRLAIGSSQSVSLSSANNPFQFYPTTLASQLDGDPIDLLSPTPGISTIRYLIALEKRLVAWGDINQLQVHSNQETLTTGTAEIDELSSYEFNENLRPQSSNGKVYFGAPKGTTATAIYEMHVTSDADITNLTDADDMTTAVPTYIPAGVDRIASCPVNFVLVYGESGYDTLTYHSFRSAQGQRVQNAFDRWNLPPGFTLGGMVFKNTRLYLLLVDSHNVAHVGMLDTAPGILDPDSSVMTTRLDMRMTEAQVTLTYDSDTDTTACVFPYPITQDAVRVVSRAPGGTGGPNIRHTPLPAPEGYNAVVLSATTFQATLKGKWTECPLWCGLKYTFRIQLSRIYAMGQDERPMRSGRLQLRKLVVDFANTGYFKVLVTSRGRAVRTYEFTGYKLDDPQSIWNAPPNVTQSFSVPIMCENEQTTIEIVNDTHFPCAILGYEWTGEFNPKASRL